MTRMSLPLNSTASREVVAVQDAAVEGAEARKFRHVRHREMARRHDDVVEFLRRHLVVGKVVGLDGELRRLVVIRNMARRRAEAHPAADAGLLDAALDVIPQHCARRVGTDRPAEMFLERVVGEFQAFLRARSTTDSDTCCHGPARRIHRARCARCSSTGRPNLPASRSTPLRESRRPWRRRIGRLGGRRFRMDPHR